MIRPMPLAEYLKPNTAVRPGPPSGECWTPPEKSKGLRHFKFSSKGNFRGAMVLDGVSVESESLGERKGTLVIRARPDTLRVVEQSPQIDYLGADGVVLTHTFDLKVFKTCGSTVAADFKPSALVAKSGIREQHRLMAPQMSPCDADEILVMTERMYSRIDVFNATLMHAMLRQTFPEDDETMHRIVARMNGPSAIADLVKKSRAGAYGFGAVVRAIATGHLRMSGPEACRIDYDAVVAPVRPEH
jgi:hypothetical protein